MGLLVSDQCRHSVKVAIFQGLDKSIFKDRMNILSVLLSTVLGKMFITSPNESWFNPFGMSFAIIFTGVIISIGVLTVRAFLNKNSI